MKKKKAVDIKVKNVVGKLPKPIILRRRGDDRHKDGQEGSVPKAGQD